MCFKHLPIEFDADGNASLKEGLADPWGVRRNAERRAARARAGSGAGPPRGRRAVTHVAGSHAFLFLVKHDRGRALAPARAATAAP